MMKKMIVAVAFALALAGCGTVSALTSKVTNPINQTRLYQAELAFDGAVKSFNELKGLCARRVLKPSCRTYVVTGQKLIRNAAAADGAARNFVDRNPTLDATNVVSAFSNIVSDFTSNVTALSETR